MLFGAAAVILTALAFEYIGGYMPCPLCLQQRYAYYVGIPLLFIGLVLIGADRPRAAALVFAVVAIAFLGNAGLGVYQAGAEWKLWPGPDTCAGAWGLATNAGGLLEDLSRRRWPAATRPPGGSRPVVRRVECGGFHRALPRRAACRRPLAERLSLLALSTACFATAKPRRRFLFIECQAKYQRCGAIPPSRRPKVTVKSISFAEHKANW